MGPAATAVVKRLAGLIAAKQDLAYTVVLGWLRTRLSFALLRTTITCLRGTRARRPEYADASAIELAVHEAKMDVAQAGA